MGGFLGAGKTTLLLAAARELERRGLRSALIFNDQDAGLVDTRFAGLRGVESREVTGGCFCCRFSDLLDELDTLRAFAPDVIFAEPVGSCTDLFASALQPLRERGETWRLAPYTVLVDPQRAAALLSESADLRLAYLFRKQIEEADLICFTKSDVSPELPAIDARVVRQISAKTGQGISAWLDEVMSGELSGRKEALDIDYEAYAGAEAALAWLNAQASIRCSAPLSPAMLLGPLLEHLDSEFTAAGIAIVHLKAIAQAGSDFVKAAICANGQEPAVEGILDASPAPILDLLLNLRVVGEADRVREIVERSLSRISGQATDLRISCFHPALPQPLPR